ncbi:hypothetical protein [Paenibacillus massiliensis]|uniref:hypothetical protein n=1 Tax=Paenibacillus massiliensis TaxID=225917 RepID=UPI00036854C2|nr:hypothetical protein [Paenibacillus massiliensis]
MSDQHKTSEDDWKSYIQGQASAEEEDRLESMLMDQEEVVTAYLRQLEQEQKADVLPELGDITAFADRIMASLPATTDMVGTKGTGYLPETLPHVEKASTAIGLVQAAVLDETTGMADKYEFMTVQKQAKAIETTKTTEITETSKITEVIPRHERVKRWYHRKWAHYAIAASITLICSYTGAFDQLSPAESLRAQSDFHTAESVSEEVMMAATGWLDRVQGR